MMVQKSGQVTKPIIVVKMPGCKLLYIIQLKGFSWPYLISKILLLIGLTFFTARLFLFSISLLFVSIHREMLVISKPSQETLYKVCRVIKFCVNKPYRKYAE